MSDFLVTYLVPVTVRIENVDSKQQAADFAYEMWLREKVVEAGTQGLDHTSFYFYLDGRDAPWALDMTVEEDPLPASDQRSCGCPVEYHLADCPIIAPPSYDPPEPDDDYNPDHEENE